jgi:cell division protein FtsX
MGSALELGKLVAASWLYRNWEEAPKLIKYYLVTAVVILMFITSMGIFGYLSKAHLETSASMTSDVSAQLQTLNDTIESKTNTKVLVDRQIQNIDNTLVKYIELGSVTKGLQEKRRLDGERKQLEQERKAVEQELVQLKADKNKLESEIKKIEVEVGPLKYIAELVYGSDAESHFDSAVRLVIIILILVFDPLAVILLIAANYKFTQTDKKKQFDDRIKQLKKMKKSSIVIDKKSVLKL